MYSGNDFCAYSRICGAEVYDPAGNEGIFQIFCFLLLRDRSDFNYCVYYSAIENDNFAVSYIFDFEGFKAFPDMRVIRGEQTGVQA